MSDIITDKKILDKFVKFLSTEYSMEESNEQIEKAKITSEEELMTVYTIKYDNGVCDKVLIVGHKVLNLHY